MDPDPECPTANQHPGKESWEESTACSLARGSAKSLMSSFLVKLKGKSRKSHDFKAETVCSANQRIHF